MKMYRYNSSSGAENEAKMVTVSRSWLMCSGVQVIRQLEQELHVKILPGTELMIDSGSHHFVKASASSDRVLVPQPSNDPRDPLVSRTKFSGCARPRKLTCHRP